MKFFDTAKSRETLNTLGAFIQKEKNPIEQATINIVLIVIVAAAFFVAGWAFGFQAGGIK